MLHFGFLAALHSSFFAATNTPTPKMKSFPASSKFLLIYQGASFFARAKEIRTYNIGAYLKFNAACALALQALEHQRFTPSYNDKSVIGLTGEWNGYALEIQYIN